MIYQVICFGKIHVDDAICAPFVEVMCSHFFSRKMACLSLAFLKEVLSPFVVLKKVETSDTTFFPGE